MKKSFFFGALALIGLTGWRPVAAQSDLSITNAAPSSVSAGQNLTYTIKISSNGTDAAKNVVLSDPLPAGTIFVSAKQTSGPPISLTTPVAGQNGIIEANIASFGAVKVHDVQGLTLVGNEIYFSAHSDTDGQELWKTDGTAAGTFEIKDINPGTSGSFPFKITNVNGTIYFTAINRNNDRELWKSDGTSAGTVEVKDIYPGTVGSQPDMLKNVNGTLYFTANDPTYGLYGVDDDPTYGVYGQELWKTDGTAAGTVLVKDICPGIRGSSPSNLTNVGGILYFQADDGVNGNELWRSNGTVAGTFLIKDINPGHNSSSFTGFASLGDSVYFTGNDGVHGDELWKTDGTAASTVMFKDILPGKYGSYPSTPILMNGTLYFSASNGSKGTGSAANGAVGNELWKSNGTVTGTTLLKDINPGIDDSLPSIETVLGNNLYFSAQTGSTGRELWKSNGTGAGTVLVKDINIGAGNSNPSCVATVGNSLYFSAEDGIHGRELWKTDGTPAHTILLKHIDPGYNVINLSGTLYFGANTDSDAPDLWKSDGTTAGTIPVIFGQTASFEVVVKVDKNWAGPLSNTATVTSDNDSNPANNAATVTTAVADTFKPTPTIDSPTENQSLTVAAFSTIKGKATDNVGVTQVLVKVLRNQDGALQYWNGTAFTATSTYFQATLASPGNTLTTWSYAISPVLKAALDTGPYLIYAYARDAASNQSNALSRSFNITSDGIRPVPTISSPTEGQSLAIASFTAINGSATDNVGVTDVLLKVTRTRGGVLQYWNGSAFTPTSAYFQATLMAPGSTATTWSYRISAQLKTALDSGAYEVLAFARDGAGNQSNALSRKFTLTASTKISAAEAPNPSANSY